MTDFTNIHNALNNLLTVLDSTASGLVDTANAQKKELLALYDRMQETNKDLAEFGSIVGEAGATMLDIEELCEDVVTKAQNAIENGIDETPSANYEDFVGFCDTCGNEILVDEKYRYDSDNSLVCGNCFNSEAKQLTLDLAESVDHDADIDNE